MRLAKHWLIIASAGMVSFSGSISAQELTKVETNTPLTSISRRDRYVFASTVDGIYRASLKTKKWERLKPPPDMPLNGVFAKQPGETPQVFYVALRSRHGPKPLPGARYGLYLTQDNGATWSLASEREDFGATLVLPNGVLFAVTGDDGINYGKQLLRSPDSGNTWRDITGNASGQFVSLEPDPNHPSLVRLHVWSGRFYKFEAEDENYQWKRIRGARLLAAKRSSDEFFNRVSSTTSSLHPYGATLSNYFQYDFGNQTQVHALEIVPLKSRYEFARGARVVVPIRVVFHFDPDILWPEKRKAAIEGKPLPKPPTPTEKFADQKERTTFWGLRVESAGKQTLKSPAAAGRRVVSLSLESTADGKTVSSGSQPAAAKYEVVTLSPSTPYEREIDLDSLADFSNPGEYRVQIIYDSGGHPGGDKTVWDGRFTSPVFTVVIR